MKKQWSRTIELILVFFLVPLILFFTRFYLKRIVIPILIIIAVLCLVMLLRDKTFNNNSLGYNGNVRHLLYRVLSRFIIGGILITFLVYARSPELLFSFPKNNFRLWLIVMIFYPVFSVYPQELIYRAFFFHRYKDLFPSPVYIICTSGLAFGLVHMVFANWIAVIMSSLGGIMFAYTYYKSRSVVVTSLEHGLWGDLVFTIGLGVYFYSGAIK